MRIEIRVSAFQFPKNDTGTNPAKPGTEKNKNYIDIVFTYIHRLGNQILWNARKIIPNFLTNLFVIRKNL